MYSTEQIGIVLNFFGFFLDIIGVSTNYWLKSYYMHTGLYLYCRHSRSSCSAVTFSGGYKVMQFLANLGFLLLLIVTIMAIVYLCKAALRENLRYKKALGILMIIGGLCTFIGAMIGVGVGTYRPSWSLILASIGGIVSFISGVLILAPVNTVNVS